LEGIRQVWNKTLINEEGSSVRLLEGTGLPLEEKNPKGIYLNKLENIHGRIFSEHIAIIEVE
jgi:hypothetical protein